MKICSACSLSLPRESFARNVNRKDGLQDQCRGCCSAYAAKWREKNQKKKRENDRAYAAANRDRAKEKTKQWALKNPERKRAADKAYAIANADRVKEVARQWREDNKEKIRAAKKLYAQQNNERLRIARSVFYAANIESNRAATRAWAAANPHRKAASRKERKLSKILATPAWASRSAIELFYLHAQHLTRATGIPHHVDHIVPLRSKWVCGLHVEYNLQVLTGEANLKKRNYFKPG